jgi:hypothetical protein
MPQTRVKPGPNPGETRARSGPGHGESHELTFVPAMGYLPEKAVAAATQQVESPVSGQEYFPYFAAVLKNNLNRCLK